MARAAGLPSRPCPISKERLSQACPQTWNACTQPCRSISTQTLHPGMTVLLSMKLLLPCCADYILKGRSVLLGTPEPGAFELLCSSQLHWPLCVKRVACFSVLPVCCYMASHGVQHV